MRRECVEKIGGRGIDVGHAAGGNDLIERGEGVASRPPPDLDDIIEDAVIEFQKAIRSRPDYLPAYLQLGVTYYMRGLVDLAVAEWEKALARKPDDKSVKAYLGFIKKKKGERNGS